MTKIKVEAVVGLAERVCNQHLKPLKLDYNMYWITDSIRAYCRSGDSYALNVLRFLVETLWFNGHIFDGDCIRDLVKDIVSWKKRGLIEKRKIRRKTNMTDYERVDVLVDALFIAYDKEDQDYQAAKPFLDSIKKWYIERYSFNAFCDYLAEHGMDILSDFRHAKIVSKEDYENPNDWEEATENALLVSDDGTSAVMSWRW